MGETTTGSGRTILIAVDESDETTYALSWCLRNFVTHSDTLLLLHAKPLPSSYTAMDGTGYAFSADITATMERYDIEVAGSLLAKAAKMCEDFGDVKVETKVEGGDARDVICRVAEKLSPDVLVMGSHGYGLIKRTILGSVSRYCAQHVQCPVLIIKRPKSA
ncbi:hypothetical protein MLD38_017808 [Melastoma candidum]|uniref:Uncharacterized protein n=1 Tax=Melastoma candidum TaxID=119954 RepID=A0ACB9QVX4_9MYRT|nr:hypothetical protein MLD38_017808 [Melastoma candidum]